MHLCTCCYLKLTHHFLDVILLIVYVHHHSLHWFQDCHSSAKGVQILMICFILLRLILSIPEKSCVHSIQHIFFSIPPPFFVEHFQLLWAWPLVAVQSLSNDLVHFWVLLSLHLSLFPLESEIISSYPDNQIVAFVLVPIYKCRDQFEPK